MSPRQSVLIVEAPEETREVLQTAFRVRGVDVYTADETDTVNEVAARVEPDVIVVDLESDTDCHRLDPAQLKRADGAEPAFVLLGTVRRKAPAHLAGQFVAKPYHYAPLIRKIESLLEQCQSSSAAGRRARA